MPSTKDRRGFLEQSLGIEPVDKHTFRAVCLEGGKNRLFGGQIVALGVRAAVATASQGHSIHSVHAYFLRPGEVGPPVTYAVTVMKDGRSFSTRRVDALQEDRLICTLIASLHVPEESTEHQALMPDVPPPNALERYLDIPPGTNPALRGCFDMRIAGRLPSGDDEDPQPRQEIWLRSLDTLDSAPGLHEGALCWVTDLTLPRTADLPHRDEPGERYAASLDHSLWFHRPFRTDEWLLFSQRSPSYADGRGMSIGHVYARDGRLVASVSQENLIRRKR